MSKLRRILVPSDGSEHARNALQFVLDLVADGVAVEIHLLNVQIELILILLEDYVELY